MVQLKGNRFTWKLRQKYDTVPNFRAVIWFFKLNFSSRSFQQYFVCIHVSHKHHTELNIIQIALLLTKIWDFVEILANLRFLRAFSMFTWGHHSNALWCPKWQAPGPAVLGECGRHSVYVYCYIRCIKYWLKILALPDDSNVKSCYIMLQNYCNNGRTIIGQARLRNYCITMVLVTLGKIKKL